MCIYIYLHFTNALYDAYAVLFVGCVAVSMRLVDFKMLNKPWIEQL